MFNIENGGDSVAISSETKEAPMGGFLVTL
ncbi:hypothetical protein FHS66_001332 [Pacificitalea manganoxidans]|nr:hypothetical protein [Pacificitalea manganoxidans]